MPRQSTSCTLTVLLISQTRYYKHSSQWLIHSVQISSSKRLGYPGIRISAMTRLFYIMTRSGSVSSKLSVHAYISVNSATSNLSKLCYITRRHAQHNMFMYSSFSNCCEPAPHQQDSSIMHKFRIQYCRIMHCSVM